MKKTVFTSSVALLALASSVYADGEYENPGLSAYMAEKGELPPPTKLNFPSPEGIYVSGTVGGGQHKSIRILVGNRERELTNDTQRKSITQGGVALGYFFKEAGWFNQADIQYIGRNNVQYVGNDPFNGSVLNASIKSQSGMLRVYSSLSIGRSVFPYIFVGGGAYNNKAPATLSYPNPPLHRGRNLATFLAGRTITLSNQQVFNAPQTIVDTSTTTNSTSFINDFGQTVVINNTSNVFTVGNERVRNSRTGGAGCAGLGVRIRFNRQIMMDLNYEYAYLGKLKDWHVFLPTSSFPQATFRGDKLNYQSFNLSFIFQPWGYLTDPD